MNPTTRIESDSMGKMAVPAEAYFGAQTARAIENFPISNLRFSRGFIRALGLIKQHAAMVNEALGMLPASLAGAVKQAAQEVAEGKWDQEFPVDIFQTGSGTSTNMNANEVIAHRASEILTGRRDGRAVHPNDHVNRGQSSNDVIPTALHLATWEAIVGQLIPELEHLQRELAARADDFAGVLKIGRTHLQDATPMRLGQEFSGYASQVEHAIHRLKQLEDDLCELALGGTAVGTGLNTHPDFARRVIEGLARQTGLKLREAGNHFERQGAIDSLVQASGVLKSVAVSLIKIANDIRWLGSGPRCGLGELKLPATQPGSSIMPGKVNPVICEMVIQVGAQVIGNDACVAFSGTFGAFELNTMLPVTAHNLLQAIELLTAAARVFGQKCIRGLQADVERCASNVERSLAMCTVLAPVIGYDRAAQIAKVAFESGRTVREVASEMAGLDPQQLASLLDPEKQAGPNPR